MTLRDCHEWLQPRCRAVACIAAAGFCLAFALSGKAAPSAGKGAEAPPPLVPTVPDPPGPEFVVLPVAAPAVASASLHCSLDTIDGNPAPLAMVIDHRVATTFVGWIADDKLGVPRDMAVLLVGGRTYAMAGATGLRRDDVAAASGKPAFRASGFSLTGRATNVPQGEYQLVMTAQYGSATELCQPGLTIAIK